MSIILSTDCRFADSSDEGPYRFSNSLISYPDLPRPGESSRKSTVANQMPRSANHKTAENDATLTLLLYKERSMHIDVYEAIQLTVIVLFSILLRRNILGPQTLEKR